jgi:hypothetical protein
MIHDEDERHPNKAGFTKIVTAEEQTQISRLGTELPGRLNRENNHGAQLWEHD